MIKALRMSRGVGEIDRAHLFFALWHARGRARELLDALGVEPEAPALKRRWFGKATLAPHALGAIELAAAEACHREETRIDGAHLLAALARGQAIGHDFARDPIFTAERVLAAWPDCVTLWDLRGAVQRKLPCQDATCVTADLWWRKLAAGDAQGRLHVWDLHADTHKLLEGMGAPLRAVAWSPAEPLVLADATLWNVETGEVVRELKGHEGAVNTVVFDSRGDVCFTGGEDTTLRVWEVASGKLLETRTRHKAPVLRVAFLHPEAPPVSRDASGTAILWTEPPKSHALPPDELAPILARHGLTPDAIRRAAS